MPIFSVIIPTYNSANFIERTIKSVLNQSFKDFEIIVVDDGSRDDTVNIIKKAESRDKRIKVVITPNSGGPTVPMNIGLNLAKGEYLAFLDHDDEWKINKLEKIYEIFTENPETGFVATNVEIFNHGDKTLTISKAPIVKNRISVDNMLSGNYFNTFSMLAVKKNVFDRIGSLDTNLFVFADFEIIVRMAIYNIPHLFLSEPLTKYHLHDKNTSALNSSASRRIKDLEYIITKYQKKYGLNKKSLSKISKSIARIHLYLGNKKEAILYFKKAISYDKSNIANYIRLFSTYFGEKAYKALNKIRSKAFRNLS